MPTRPGTGAPGAAPNGATTDWHADCSDNRLPCQRGDPMDIGVFIPINNNGWIISATSPQYMPSFELTKQVVLKAVAYGLDFAPSVLKVPGFGGKTEFWDHGLESFPLVAGLASVTARMILSASTWVL